MKATEIVGLEVLGVHRLVRRGRVAHGLDHKDFYRGRVIDHVFGAKNA
jgi:hypothetical protein